MNKAKGRRRTELIASLRREIKSQEDMPLSSQEARWLDLMEKAANMLEEWIE